MKSLLPSVALLFALPAGLQAALISGPDEISATTSISSGGFGSIDQIVDGIGLEADGPPFNGYGPDVQSGTITLTLLGGTYTIYDFIIANDINVMSEGVRDFTLSFYDATDSLILTTGTFTALGGTLAYQTFSVGTVENVVRVDLNVLNVYTENVPRIEIREVAFNGVLVPEPSAILLGGLGTMALLGRRRRH